MKSVILCEGSTDYVLLQYFMRKAYGWEDIKKHEQIVPFKMARTLIKNNDKLTIGSAGGCSQIPGVFEKLIERNQISSDNPASVQNIVIVTDRDEAGTEAEFLKSIMDILQNREVSYDGELNNGIWLTCSVENGRQQEVCFKILTLIIPFEETGALETFLLNSVSKESDYDKKIIDAGNEFVENVDPERRYLTCRRYVTKAKFDVYFSIRTSVAQFNQRQDILKGVDWEKYLAVQECFKELANI